METLRRGMTGPDVQRWQTFLIAGGFLSGALLRPNNGDVFHEMLVL